MGLTESYAYKLAVETPRYAAILLGGTVTDPTLQRPFFIKVSSPSDSRHEETSRLPPTAPGHAYEFPHIQHSQSPQVATNHHERRCFNTTRNIR